MKAIITDLKEVGNEFLVLKSGYENVLINIKAIYTQK